MAQPLFLTIPVQVLKNKGVLVLLAKSICRISWEELPLRVMNVKDEP